MPNALQKVLRRIVGAPGDGPPAKAAEMQPPRWPEAALASAAHLPVPPRESWPVIVLGHNRSGTTFVIDVLHQLGIATTSEMRVTGDRRRRLDAIFDQVTGTAERKAWRRIDDLQPRLAEIYETICYASSSPHQYRRPHGARFANKTPDMEHHVEFYEALFGRHVLYVYCLRHGRDVIVSSLNTAKGMQPPRGEPAAFDAAAFRRAVEAWKSSVRRLEACRAEFPDRIHVFQVDRAEAIEERRTALEALTTFLGGNFDGPTLDRIADSWKPINDRPAMTYRDVDRAQLDALARDGEFQAMLARYGYARVD